MECVGVGRVVAWNVRLIGLFRLCLPKLSDRDTRVY